MGNCQSFLLGEAARGGIERVAPAKKGQDYGGGGGVSPGSTLRVAEFFDRRDY